MNRELYFRREYSFVLTYLPSRTPALFITYIFNQFKRYYKLQIEVHVVHYVVNYIRILSMAITLTSLCLKIIFQLLMHSDTLTKLDKLDVVKLAENWYTLCNWRNFRETDKMELYSIVL